MSAFLVKREVQPVFTTDQIHRLIVHRSGPKARRQGSRGVVRVEVILWVPLIGRFVGSERCRQSTPHGPADTARMRLHRQNVKRYSPSQTGVPADYNSDSSDFAAAIADDSCGDCSIESDAEMDLQNESDYIVVMMTDMGFHHGTGF